MPLERLNHQFQSRNRVSSLFKDITETWGVRPFLFQSRNRVSSLFKDKKFTERPADEPFQSRNRVSSLFKCHRRAHQIRKSFPVSIS